jgi:predicted nuclease of predicted toxin-antitoxin system
MAMKQKQSQGAGATMTRRNRLRRVVILCRNFAWNLAYYRAGQMPQNVVLHDASNSEANFWRVAGANFLDVCVLEWCKLLPDPKDQHHWSRVVSDTVGFKNVLLLHLGIDDATFEQEITAMRRYRDKFLAHLDSDLTMHIPVLDKAKQAVWLYHGYVVQHEASAGDLGGLPIVLDPGYATCEAEASAIYRRNRPDEPRR